MFLSLASIEGHAEHGGTLNEHQLSRLVRYFYIYGLVNLSACLSLMLVHKT
jgi:hypothetical protein